MHGISCNSVLSKHFIETKATKLSLYTVTLHCSDVHVSYLLNIKLNFLFHLQPLELDLKFQAQPQKDGHLSVFLEKLQEGAYQYYVNHKLLNATCSV